MATGKTSRSALANISHPPAAVALLSGYTAVIACVGWLVGIWLARVPLALVTVSLWLTLAVLCALLWVALRVLRQRLMSPASQWSRSAAVAQALLLLALWIVLGGLRGAWQNPALAPDAVSRLPYGATVDVVGDVSQEPVLEATGRLLTISVSQASTDGGAHWQPATGLLEAHVGGPDDWFAPAYGDTLQLSGKLKPVTGSAPADVLASMSVISDTIVARGGGSPIFAWLFTLRIKIAQGIQHSLPEPEAALLIGILLGLKTPVLRARLALFTATGTIHLVVPAGLKVSVLADLSRRATLVLGRWVSTGVSLAMVGVYAALGGGGPAAVRAAIMGALLVLATVFGRRYDVFAALAAAAFIMTALDPGLIFDVGFQLTMLATLGIPLFTPPLERLAVRTVARVPFADALRPLIALVAVTVAAQLATLPIIAEVFGIVSFVAPLANLLVVPLLAALLLLGGLVALLVLAWPAAAGIGGLAAWPLLWLTDRAIEACAGIPGATIAVASTPAWITPAYYGTLGALVVTLWLWARSTGKPVTPPASAGTQPPRQRAILRTGLALVSLLVIVELWATSPALRQPVIQVDALGVGPGGWATLVRLADGTTALIDGGASGPSLDLALARVLPFWQRHLSVVALTDPGAGSEAGLQDALAHYSVDHAVDMGVLHPSKVYLAWLDALRQYGVARTRLQMGDVITLGPQSDLRILAPPAVLYPDHEGTTSESNDLIVRLELPGLRMLLLGNADSYALDALASSGQLLTADVVEVALPPTTDINLDQPLGAVLRLAHPRLIIIQQAPRPPGRRPSGQIAGGAAPQDAALSNTLGATIVRLTSTGSLSLQAGANGVWSYRESSS